MVRRKAAGGVRKAKGTRKARKASLKTRRKASAKKAVVRRARVRSAKRAAKPARPRRKRPLARASSVLVAGKAPRLDRERRTLIDDDSVPTPPSSLNMNRRGSAARTGRAEIAEHRQDHIGMT